MTGKARILAVLDGRPAEADHLPVMPITMMFAADTAGGTVIVGPWPTATDHTDRTDTPSHKPESR